MVMKTSLLKLSIFSGLLLFLGYGALKIQSSKVKAQKLSESPPIADFEMAPASAPQTPFRLVWQHVDPKGAILSPDWKFLAKTHGASTSLVSTENGRFVRRVQSTLYPQNPSKIPSDTSVLHPKIRSDLLMDDHIEAWSSKAQLVAIRGFKSRVYSLANGRKLWGLTVPQYGPKVFLGFSPNGKWMLTREGDKYGRNEKHYLRDARTGTVLRRFDWPSSPYDTPLGFSPDSRRFGVFDRGVKFYEMPSGKQAWRYDGFIFGAGTVEFARDAQTIITSEGGDETVAEWNPRLGRTTRYWDARYNAAGALAMSPDGKFLASGSSGSCGRDLVRVWDFATHKELWVAPSGYNSWGVSDVKWSPDGTLLASASYRGPPQIWNAKSGQRIAVLGGAVFGKGTQASYSDDSIQQSEPSLFWSSDARELWVGGSEGIKIWSRNGQFLRDIKTVGKIASLARCPSGQRVVIGTSSGEIVLLRVKDSSVLWRKKVAKETLDVAFLPSDRVVSWSQSGISSKILIWDAKGGFTTQTLEAPLGTRKVAVSRDGKRLVSVGDDGIMLWETALETTGSK